MKKLIPIFVIVLSLLLAACTTTQQIPEEKYCEQDRDCVPAECCHPSDAVNKDFAPNCTSTLCTLECKPGTLDCNQGEIKCVENTCTAIIEE